MIGSTVPIGRLATKLLFVSLLVAAATFLFCRVWLPSVERVCRSQRN